MDDSMLDWEDLKTFLAITRHRSLSAAARALHVSQTTMGRRLAALEGRAGAKLLQRMPSGFVLTPVGEHVVANVERMEAEALAAECAILGKDLRLEGLVTIAAVETLTAEAVLQALSRLHATHPNITIEVISDRHLLNLARREADMAIRMEPFKHHSVVVRRLADISFDVYASESYLAKYGLPDWSRCALGHRVIVLKDCPAAGRWLAETAAAASKGIIADSHSVQVDACSAGLGLAVLPCYIADEVPSLRRLDAPTRPPTQQVWLGVHKDLRQTPRIRVVLDILTMELRRRAAQFAPPRADRKPVPNRPRGNSNGASQPIRA
jgi:DNA-binding transcriptional LysR family regulator